MLPQNDGTAPSGLQRTLPSSAYLDAGSFARERERIFFREWFCVGRTEALPGPGDFLRVEVAGERVLVVRRKDGGLAGHYDVCRHRGSRLALDVDPQADLGPVPSGRFRDRSSARTTAGPTRSRESSGSRRSSTSRTDSPSPSWRCTRWGSTRGAASSS